MTHPLPKAGLFTAAAIFVFDQLTKWLVGGPIGLTTEGQNIHVLPFFDLTRVHIGEFRPFLVFNVADAAISIGVVILILRALLIKDPAPKESSDHA